MPDYQQINPVRSQYTCTQRDALPNQQTCKRLCRLPPNSNFNPLFVRIACEALADAPVPTSSSVQQAEAYQVSLASELQQHFISLIHSQLDVDLLCEKFETCLQQVTLLYHMACRKQASGMGCIHMHISLVLITHVRKRV